MYRASFEPHLSRECRRDRNPIAGEGAGPLIDSPHAQNEPCLGPPPLPRLPRLRLLVGPRVHARRSLPREERRGARDLPRREDRGLQRRDERLGDEKEERHPLARRRRREERPPPDVLRRERRPPVLLARRKDARLRLDAHGRAAALFPAARGRRSRTEDALSLIHISEPTRLG